MDIKSFPVILYNNEDRMVMCPEHHNNILCLRMSRDVDDRLLDDPEQGDLNPRIESLVHPGIYGEIVANPLFAEVFVKEPFDGGTEPEIVEDRRPQVLDNMMDAIEAL